MDVAPDDDHVVIDPSVLYVGTPAYLVVTRNADGNPNVAPASSHWALGRMLVLGLETDGQTAANLAERPELTVNFPSSDLWRHVERLSAVTGRDPVPAAKADHYRFEPSKFELAGLRPQPSEVVAPPRVHECPLQFEGIVRRETPGVDPGYLVVEVEVVRVHALPELVVPGTNHIDANAWHPLIYSFRHYFDRGAEVGWTRKSAIAPSAPDLSDVPPRAESVSAGPAATSASLDELVRWEAFGGTWAVLEATRDGAIVSLCRCDGGEEVSRITSDDPGFIEWAAKQLVCP
ncbi:flavin reductase family protein [Agromyces neolithicus]|uniref:Flavin reductase like domain-containing protein n=1 Tax=Agromyces neolithicus TaxID=269420 RepID=A0ABN2LX24_9MICO